MRSTVVVAASCCCAAVLAGCASTSTAGNAEIFVFAAASLKSTFTELGRQFESEHPGRKVTFNFAGSSDLAAQITLGAPADVFAAADTANMAKVVETGLVAGDPVDFATNTLTIVTPSENPKEIAAFADLAKPDVQLVVCAPPVPCGSATEAVEEATGVTLTPISEESAVVDVLNKITTGQADAGLVYVTDAAGAEDAVASIPFPESGVAVNTYSIAALEESTHPAAAEDFLDLVSGDQGRKVLASAGFAAP
ncbi:MAG: molybdate ABC transporter substrate-binding protein [Actinomycetia bacterium]|nr:molybdate ABC transporter substrate-binding protein [Actinomycetes bacterium]MCH9768417.1 molybdate ABC transporter substrate-binding protein [Actinomycetes bacterium]